MKFVVTGFPRSGTTILARMINQIPNVVCTHELMTWMGTDHHPNFRDRILSTRERLKNKLKDFNIFSSPHFSRSKFFKEYDTFHPITPSEVASCFAKWNFEHYGDKSPEYCRNVERVIQNVGENATWIFIKRNPKNILGSLRDGYAGYCSTDFAKSHSLPKRDSLDADASENILSAWASDWEKQKHLVKNLITISYENLENDFVRVAVELFGSDRSVAERIIKKMFKERRIDKA